MKDLIRRQDAIDSILECCTSDCDNEYECGYDDGLRKGVHKLKHLPSAQPEIIRCKECKWFGDLGCAIRIVDDSDKPTENDYCSFAERRSE